MGDDLGEAERPSPARSPAPGTISAHGVQHLGFDLQSIESFYSLDAELTTAAWASSTDDASEARDEDLDTAWTCEVKVDSSCALSVQFPQASMVTAIRLYAAGSPGQRERGEVARISQLRLHTDDGYVDIDLPEGRAHRSVLFDEPVSTHDLSLEVLATHGMSAQDRIAIAEIEIYGIEGAPREGLNLDPRDAYVDSGANAWHEREHDSALRPSFLGFVDAVGQRRSFTRGTAIYGRRGDDYLLIENIRQTDCDTNKGSYVLLDQRSRMVYSLGDMGGAGGSVYRHMEGKGFFVGHVDRETIASRGITEVAGRLKWADSSAHLEPVEQLERWGVDAQALARGGRRASVLPPGCQRISAGPPELAEASEYSDWVECAIDGDRHAYLGSDTCGEGWGVILVDDQGELLAHEGHDEHANRGMRFLRSASGLLVEVQGAGSEESRVLRIHGGGIETFGSGTTLAVRPPSHCGCGDEFVNLRAPEDLGADDYTETC
jgi:hypothetical protein